MASLTGYLDTAARTHVGRRRVDNQDSVLRVEDWSQPSQSEAVRRYGHLYLVADGVGGNDQGDVASRMVVDTVMAHFYAADPAVSEPVARLDAAIQCATAAVYAEADRRGNNMASTLVAALVGEQQVVIANVGDSPAFLVRHGEPTQKLTVDHIRRDYDGSSSLAQAMGDPEVSVAFCTLRWYAGDTLVLCSDGLSDLLQADEIKRVVRGSSAPRACHELIQRANGRGGHDNISAVVVRHGSLPLVAQTFFQQLMTTAAGVALLCALLMAALPTVLGASAPGALNEQSQGPMFRGLSIAVPQLNPTTGLTEMVQATITPTPDLPQPTVQSQAASAPKPASGSAVPRQDVSAVAPTATPAARASTIAAPARTTAPVTAPATTMAPIGMTQPTARPTDMPPRPTAVPTGRLTGVPLRPTDAPPPTARPTERAPLPTARPTDVPTAVGPTSVPEAPSADHNAIAPASRPADNPPPAAAPEPKPKPEPEPEPEPKPEPEPEPEPKPEPEPEPAPKPKPKSE